MEKKKYLRIILVAACGVALLATGFAIGAYWSWKQAQRVYPAMYEFAAPAMMGQYSLTHYFGKDNKAAKEALLEHLHFLEELHSKGDQSLSDRYYHFESILVLTRLYKVEKRAGVGDSAERYMSQAINLCENAGYDECTRDNWLKIVDRLDSQSVFNLERELPDNKTIK